MTEQRKKEIREEFAEYLRNNWEDRENLPVANWWLKVLDEEVEKAREEESIKRYNQAKEDGTLDKHFPRL